MADETLWRRWRRQVHDILEVGGDAHPAGRAVNAFIITLIFLNAIAFAAETVDHVADRYGAYLDAFNVFSVMVFSIEYVLRIWSAVEIPMLSRMPHWRARLRFAARPIMIIDLLAVLPWYLQPFFSVDLRSLRVFRLFRLLKLVRYSPALQTLGRVLADEYRALLGALLVLLILLLFASTTIYFLEREAQPDKFGSVPAAAWWALATLTTVGYGDVVPVTPLGKVVGGIVMLLGVGMVALPVAIIATGFSQESNRHQFVVTWSMVARVPLFASMDESEIAEICKLLYTRTYSPGVPIVRTGGRGRCDVSHRRRRGCRRNQSEQAGAVEGGRLLRRDGAARTPPPQARCDRQDEVPRLCARNHFARAAYGAASRYPAAHSRHGVSPRRGRQRGKLGGAPTQSPAALEDQARREAGVLTVRPPRGRIACRRLSPILSRKPLVDSQPWSAPTRRARSLVMNPPSMVATTTRSSVSAKSSSSELSSSLA
jgi:voltage-gated potassium channel